MKTEPKKYACYAYPHRLRMDLPKQKLQAESQMEAHKISEEWRAQGYMNIQLVPVTGGKRGRKKPGRPGGS